MEWSNIFDGSRNEKLEEQVLDALKPHSDNLKDLVIHSYGGNLFPNWIGDPSFLRLTSVRIGNCGNLGSEFLGRGIAFPKLEILRIEYMRGWEIWSTKSGVVGAVMFPCLQELYILYRPNLAEVSLETLPSLRVLDLNGCGDGVLTSLIHVASSVTKLSIQKIVLEASQLSHMLPLSLTKLELWGFEKLESFQGDTTPPSLQHLKIEGCPKMKDQPEELCAKFHF
ncbi:NB-ARC domains-containing protein [Tanacetum coccineum]